MIVHFLNVRTSHHSEHSGYDRFMDYIPNAPLPSSRKWESMAEDERKRAYEEAKAQVSWYNPPDLEMETNVNALNPWFRKHVCHFLYGENSLYHIQKFKNPRKKVYASFHQPPEAHQQFVRSRSPLKNIDGVVVVGRNQIPFFEQFIDRSRIFFVPHGVDTDYFKPDFSIKKDPRRILFVGNWLRDFETLANTASLLNERAPDIIVDVVTLEKNRHIFKDIPNVIFSSGIPEADLLRKYQEASLLVVPVKDCTANNSVLEGMACGLPIITTNIGGNKDYIDEDCCVLCRASDAAELAGSVVGLLNNATRLTQMATASRKRSLSFAWPVVSEAMVSAYAQAFTQR